MSALNISAYQLSAGMSLISKQVLTAPVASITFSSLPQIYTHLLLVICAGNDSDSAAFIDLTVNGDNGVSYSSSTTWNEDGNIQVQSSVGNRTISVGIVSGVGNNGSTTQVTFGGYSTPGINKSTVSVSSYCEGIASSNIVVGGAVTSNTNVISIITITLGGTINFTAGSSFSLYGLA